MKAHQIAAGLALFLAAAIIIIWCATQAGIWLAGLVPMLWVG